MGFLARLTTYVAGFTPRIKAADLNAIQDAIVEIFLGSKSLKKVQVDGTGNAATTIPDGSLGVSRVATGITAPSPGLAAGEYTRSTAIAGVASVNSAGGGTIYALSNVHSIAFGPGPGEVDIVFLRVPGAGAAGDEFKSCVQCTSTPGLTAGWIKSLDGSGRLLVEVRITQPGGGAFDGKVDVLALIF